MRKRATIPLLIPMACAIFLAAQPPAAPTPVRTTLPAKTVRAHEQAAQARIKLLDLKERSAIAAERAQKGDVQAQREQQTLQQQVQQASNEVLQAVEKAREETPPSVPVANGDRLSLETVIEDFHNRRHADARWYSNVELTFTIFALLMGAGSALLNIFGRSKIATGMTVLMTLTVGIPRAIPVHERAEHNNVLANQSYALLVESRLAIGMTKTQHDDIVRRFQVLLAAEKQPGSSAAATEELIKKLGAIGTPSA